MSKFLVGSKDSAFVARGWTIVGAEAVVVLKDRTSEGWTVLVGTYPNQKISSYMSEIDACIYAGGLCGV